MATDTEYIVDPIDTDVDALQQEAFEYLQAKWPDWAPSEGNLTAWMVAACARMVAEARDVAADVPPAVFRYYGRTVLGIPPVDPTSSTVDSTWTLTTNPDGRTIEAGTWVIVEDADAVPVTFEVVADVVLAVGVLVANGVGLRSIEEGAYTAGLGGAGVEVNMLDPVAWVDTVVLAGVTIGGQDGESDEDYEDRLSARLTLLTPRPILPRDFELLAKDIAAQNGVDVRVLALDGYNPGDGTFSNERMITVVMVDDVTGANVSGALKTIVDNELQGTREVNFIVHIIDPTRSVIGVAYQAVTYPGFDAAAVEAAADAALTEFIDPANYGRSSSERGGWINKPILRYQDLMTVLNNVEGLDYVTSLTITLGVDPPVSTDVTLPGAAPIADIGAIGGVVTNPA